MSKYETQADISLGYWKFLVGYWIFNLCDVPVFGFGRRQP